MRTRWAVVWRVVRIALAVLIVGGVSWHFAKILRRPELWQKPLHLDPLWLLLTMILYAAGSCCWGGYWLRLLHLMGERLALPLAARAYFISQLGKYVRLAVPMRVGYARAGGVRISVAAITATYETLVTIAAGAVVAAVLFPLLETEDSSMGWKALGLLAIAGIPILPGIFNWLAARVAKPFLPPDAPPLPRLKTSALLSGLLQSSLGWLCLGASLVTLLRAIDRDGEHAASVPWLVCTAYVSLSYVAGFLTPTTGGLGVRETILQLLLVGQFNAGMGADTAESFAVVVVLLLRLAWTVTELTLAGLSAILPRLTERKSIL